MKCFSIFLWASLLAAQTPSTPIAGSFVDENGDLVAVRGVFGSLLPRVPLVNSDPVLSAAFGKAGGAIKTASQVLSLDLAGHVQGSQIAAEGSACFGFDESGLPGWYYVAGEISITGVGSHADIPLQSLGGTLEALGVAASGRLPVLSQSGSQLWAETIDVKTGAVIAQAPIAGALPAVYFDGGWLVARGAGLLWQGTDGNSREIDTPANVVSLAAAGPSSVAINGKWLLNSSWQIVEIPASHYPRPLLRVRPPGVER